MIRLNFSAGPEWVELQAGVHGIVRVLVDPPVSAVVEAARLSLGEMDETQSLGAAGVMVGKAIGRIVIREWEGVGDADGNPVPVTPEGIDALLDIHPVYESFAATVMARAFAIIDEKNASAPSLNGTSPGAVDTAETAPVSASSAPGA